jgi:superfamily I DNA and/or RNA helicase
MKKLNYGIILAITVALTSCSSFKKKDTGTTASTSGENVQTEQQNPEAFSKAASLTSGWPASSMTAAQEMINKYGEPHEKTSESLIWRNIAPFKKIIVHRNVYSHRFPLLHQNALEHVVDYKAPEGKVDDVWKYNGSIVLNRTNGEMSSFAENEAMNILALNLADEVMRGRISADAARITFGKQTLNYLNGKKDAYTEVLAFGSQYQTADLGESVTNKIRWIGDPANQKKSSSKLNTRQAQEEKK